MKRLIISFAVALLVVTISCSNSSEPEKQFKDPRDMTWTVDTITYPNSLQVCLNSIWGSSPTDVYAVGHNESNGGQFWHYDGTSWKSIDLFQYVDMGSWTLRKVSGFDANDLIIIGARDYWLEQKWSYKSLILRRKDNTWSDLKLNYTTSLNDITSTSPSNIWACGRDGIVLHYNGFSWYADTIKIKKMPVESDYIITGITILDKELLIVARTYNPYLPLKESYFIRGTMKNWKIVDSTILNAENWDGDEKFGNRGIFKTSSNKIYSYGDGGIWELNNNQWNSCLSNNYSINCIFGLGDKYLFATADFGNVWLNDGSGWKLLSGFLFNQRAVGIKSGWTNGQEIFLLGHDGVKTYIFHGK